jgi:hypothetical protein
VADTATEMILIPTWGKPSSRNVSPPRSITQGTQMLTSIVPITKSG